MTDSTDAPRLRALALACSLKPSPAESSTDLLAQQLLDALAEHGVERRVVRVVDHDVRPGVERTWVTATPGPAIREKMLAADILVLATPTWMGQHEQRLPARARAPRRRAVRDRRRGPPRTFGKVAVAAVVGNEDGAHHISALALPGAQRRRLHHAGAGRDVLERRGHAHDRLQGPRRDPRADRGNDATLAANAAHLARLLRGAAYPPA